MFANQDLLRLRFNAKPGHDIGYGPNDSALEPPLEADYGYSGGANWS